MHQSQLAARIPFARSLAASVRRAVQKRQFHSHDFGMVGFVKELIDELGMADITRPEHGIKPQRASKFREMRISPSHLFVIKA